MTQDSRKEGWYVVLDTTDGKKRVIDFTHKPGTAENYRAERPDAEITTEYYKSLGVVMDLFERRTISRYFDANGDPCQPGEGAQLEQSDEHEEHQEPLPQ